MFASAGKVGFVSFTQLVGCSIDPIVADFCVYEIEIGMLRFLKDIVYTRRILG